jgi:hypothetical protein
MAMSASLPRPIRRARDRVKLRPWCRPPTPRSSRCCSSLPSSFFGAGACSRLDFALQHHLHAIHVYRIACAQQGHPAHRSTIHVDAADTIADLQPEAAIVHAELRQQQGAVAGIAEPHAAVGLAHDALHPGPQGLVGLLLLTEVNKQVLHAAQPSRLVANEEELR